MLGSSSRARLASEIAALLLRAEDLFAEADQALADGDLGTYQAKVDEARDLLAKRGGTMTIDFIRPTG